MGILRVSNPFYHTHPSIMTMQKWLKTFSHSIRRLLLPPAIISSSIFYSSHRVRSEWELKVLDTVYALPERHSSHSHEVLGKAGRGSQLDGKPIPTLFLPLPSAAARCQANWHYKRLIKLIGRNSTNKLVITANVPQASVTRWWLKRWGRGEEGEGRGCSLPHSIVSGEVQLSRGRSMLICDCYYILHSALPVCVCTPSLLLPTLSLTLSLYCTLVLD